MGIRAVTLDSEKIVSFDQLRAGDIAKIITSSRERGCEHYDGIIVLRTDCEVGYLITLVALDGKGTTWNTAPTFKFELLSSDKITLLNEEIKS